MKTKKQKTDGKEMQCPSERNQMDSFFYSMEYNTVVMINNLGSHVTCCWGSKECFT